ASKVFGIIMTMLGIGLAGWIIARFGKRAAILAGTALPILGNFAYADLAEGGPWIDRFAGATGLTWFFALFGFDERMVRLMLEIRTRDDAQDACFRRGHAQAAVRRDRDRCFGGRGAVGDESARQGEGTPKPAAERT